MTKKDWLINSLIILAILFLFFTFFFSIPFIFPIAKAGGENECTEFLNSSLPEPKDLKFGTDLSSPDKTKLKPTIVNYTAKEIEVADKILAGAPIRLNEQNEILNLYLKKLLELGLISVKKDRGYFLNDAAWWFSPKRNRDLKLLLTDINKFIILNVK